MCPLTTGGTRTLVFFAKGRSGPARQVNGSTAAGSRTPDSAASSVALKQEVQRRDDLEPVRRKRGHGRFQEAQRYSSKFRRFLTGCTGRARPRVRSLNPANPDPVCFAEKGSWPMCSFGQTEIGHSQRLSKIRLRAGDVWQGWLTDGRQTCREQRNRYRRMLSAKCDIPGRFRRRRFQRRAVLPECEPGSVSPRSRGVRRRDSSRPETGTGAVRR